MWSFLLENWCIYAINNINSLLVESQFIKKSSVLILTIEGESKHECVKFKFFNKPFSLQSKHDNALSVITFLNLPYPLFHFISSSDICFQSTASIKHVFKVLWVLAYRANYLALVTSILFHFAFRL
jgi:hypothetical protein